MSFLRNYLTYNSGNECPDEFHMWVALSLLSSTVGPKVYVDRGYFTIYTNLYVTLVGLQGSRKTTAKDIGFDLIRDALGTEHQHSSECESKEFICKHLANPLQQKSYKDPAGKQHLYTPYSIYATELKNFLSINPVVMVDFLTTIYDRTGKIYEGKTKNKGEDKIVSPFINFLACETPEWLSARLKETVISGGFCRRMIFVYSTEAKAPVAFPKKTPEAVEAYRACVAWLREIKDVQGEFTWGEGTKEWFEQWYNKHKAQKHTNSFMEGWASSKDAQLLKVAMGVSLSESKMKVLELNHFLLSLEIIDRLEVNLPTLIASIGRNELAQPTMKILDIIKANNGIVAEKVVRRDTLNVFNGSEFMSAIYHLTSTDQLIKRKMRMKGETVDREYLMLPEISQQIDRKMADLNKPVSAASSAPPPSPLPADKSKKDSSP